MMHQATRQEELDRIDTLTTLDAVAYANRLSNRLKCDDCTDEERKSAVVLLRLLTERVHFLKITLEPEKICRIRWGFFAESGEAIK